MKDIIVNKNCTIKQALKQMNNSTFKCLIVINSKKNFLGTLTDGDLRRGLIKNSNLLKSINNLYNKNSYFVYENKYNPSYVIKKLKSKKLILVPVVDNKNKLVDFITSNKLLLIKTKKKIKNINIPVVIMAGGKGTRLFPFTDVLPKPLIPINNKTVVELIIENYTKFNIKNFTISINFKSKILKAFFEEINPKYNVNFIEEKKPLGTAGSLSLLNYKTKGSFILCNCDILAKYNVNKFYTFHKKNNFDITILSSKNNFNVPYGSILFDQDKDFIKIQEKPIYTNYINIGVYLINFRVLQNIKKNKFLHITDLINNNKKFNLKIGVHLIKEENWKDIGQWDQFHKSVRLMNNDPK